MMATVEHSSCLQADGLAVARIGYHPVCNNPDLSVTGPRNRNSNVQCESLSVTCLSVCCFRNVWSSLVYVKSAAFKMSRKRLVSMFKTLSAGFPFSLAWYI